MTRFILMTEFIKKGFIQGASLYQGFLGCIYRIIGQKTRVRHLIFGNSPIIHLLKKRPKPENGGHVLVQKFSGIFLKPKTSKLQASQKTAHFHVIVTKFCVTRNLDITNFHYLHIYHSFITILCNKGYQTMAIILGYHNNISDGYISGYLLLHLLLDMYLDMYSWIRIMVIYNWIPIIQFTYSVYLLAPHHWIYMKEHFYYRHGCGGHYLHDMKIVKYIV